MNHEAHTPLRESYFVTGARFVISTNSGEVLTAARDSFRQAVRSGSSPVLTMRLWVDPTAQSSPPWPQPYFRGLSHLVYAGFDCDNSLLLDLRGRRLVGRLSRSMAQDGAYWRRVVFPAIVGLASDALNITVLHCGCVERDGSGLLLAGESGSGKSTLSLAMAQNGFTFLSDDWTYLCLSSRRLRAWSLAAPLKLLPDAVQYFPELRSLEPGIAMNGERSYEVDPEQVFGIRRSFRCEPRWLIFLERQKQPGHSLVRIPSREAAARLEFDMEDLPPELSPAKETQREAILTLVKRECWLLRHGESPHDIAQVLVRLCAGPAQKVPRGVASKNDIHLLRTGPDLTRRLTPTPYVADFCPSGRAIRMETNSPTLLRQVRRALGSCGKTQPSSKPFLWRLISDPDAGLHLPWPDFSIVSANGLLFANIGQRSFLAADREARCAVGFLADRLLKDEEGFEEFFLAGLLSMTAAAGWPSGLQL